MALTAAGFPYVQPSDSLVDFPAASLALANKFGNVAIALPASPANGDEVILVDSLTLPTYAWRFRYVAAITDASKWLFIGGSPKTVEVATSEIIAGAAYTNLATVGPSFTLPRAGVYEIGLGFKGWSSSAANQARMSYAIDAAVAVDADATFAESIGGGSPTSVSAHARFRVKTFAAASALVAKYKVSAGTPLFEHRWLRVIPVRVT